MKFLPFVKYFAIGLLLGLACRYATASECSTQREEQVETQIISSDVPSKLKGAIIVVVTADGTHYNFKADKFKVVPRKQQHLVTKTLQVVSCQNTSYNKNRVSLLGGYGAKDGLKRSSTSDSVSIESKTGVVGGVQYQRSLTEKFSIGVQAQSNKTGSAMIGLDF